MRISKIELKKRQKSVRAFERAITAARVSVKEVATNMGLHPSSIHGWFRGVSVPTGQRLADMKTMTALLREQARSTMETPTPAVRPPSTAMVRPITVVDPEPAEGGVHFCPNCGHNLKRYA